MDHVNPEVPCGELCRAAVLAQVGFSCHELSLVLHDITPPLFNGHTIRFSVKTMEGWKAFLCQSGSVCCWPVVVVVHVGRGLPLGNRRLRRHRSWNRFTSPSKPLLDSSSQYWNWFKVGPAAFADTSFIHRNHQLVISSQLQCLILKTHHCLIKLTKHGRCDRT